VPGVRFGSINTGLPANIVDQIMDAERIPVKTMKDKKEKTEAKSKLVEDLTSKIGEIRKGLGELASTRGFSDIKLQSGDPNVVSGTVDPATYQPGSWNVEVVQLAQKAAAVTNGFADKDKTTIGVGFMRFKTPEGNKDVYIDSSSNTLEGVAKKINGAKIGIHAAIINDRKNPDEPFKLVISSDNVGAEKNVSYPRIYMLDGDQDIYFDSESKAKNGVVKVDGYEFEIADNNLKDVIPGVTLELRQASPGHSVNVTVKEDHEVVSGKVKTFVDSLNAVLQFIQTQNKLDKGTDTSKTLGGDSLLRSIEQRMRNLLQNPQYGLKSDITLVAQLGITFNRNGLVELDQKKFNAVLSRSPEAVEKFFVGDGFSTGFVNSVKREISTLLNPSFGPLTNRANGLKQSMEQLDERIANKERQLAKREEMLRDKFARLEETMSNLKSQSGAVASLGGGGGGITSLISG
jgi:flagellar hook-associated protein 2